MKPRLFLSHFVYYHVQIGGEEKKEKFTHPTDINVEASDRELKIIIQFEKKNLTLIVGGRKEK